MQKKILKFKFINHFNNSELEKESIIKGMETFSDTFLMLKRTGNHLDINNVLAKVIDIDFENMEIYVDFYATMFTGSILLYPDDMMYVTASYNMYTETDILFICFTIHILE